MTERVETAAEAAPPTAGSESPPETKRVDGPHAAAEPVAGRPVVADDPLEPTSPVNLAGGLDQRQLLKQASQVAASLEARIEELDRREQHLNSRSTQFDQELRATRLKIRQREEELAEQAESIDVREREVDVRDQQLRQSAGELDQRDTETAELQVALEGQRAELRVDVEREFESEQRQLVVARGELEQQRVALEQQVAGIETERVEKLTELQQQFARREQQLKRELTEERMTEELQAERRQFDYDRAEYERRSKQEQQALRQARQEHRDQVDGESQQLAELNSTTTAELDKQRRDLVRELEQTRQTFQADQEQQLAELQQQRALLENRHLFQEEHLSRARGQLEAEQHAFRAERQQAIAADAARRGRLERQSRQLDQFRGRLAERETSLDRTRKGLGRTQRAAEESLATRQNRFESERAASLEQHTAADADRQRQAESLARQVQDLASRGQGIEQLQHELETTHRETLEMRLAVEEAQARLAENQGVEGARELVEAAREALSDHFAELRKVLNRQRTELGEASRLFLQQQEEFRTERQTLTDWIAERDENLRLREEVLSGTEPVIEEREAAWQVARERWMGEKLDAEAIIRDLLGQLDSLVAEPSNESGSDDVQRA